MDNQQQGRVYTLQYFIQFGIYAHLHKYSRIFQLIQ
jgi:hypothetical protein